MLCEADALGNTGKPRELARDARRSTVGFFRALTIAVSKQKPTGSRPAGFGVQVCWKESRLALAFLFAVLVVEDFIDANHLSVERARNQAVVLDLSVLRVGDRDAIHIKRASDGAFVVGLGLDE